MGQLNEWMDSRTQKWLWDETHVHKVEGSNPSPVWMDIFHIDLLKNGIVCLKNTEK